MRRLLSIALLLLAIGPANAEAEIQVGQVAPNFTKNRLDGGQASLSDHAGKVVVLFLLGWT